MAMKPCGRIGLVCLVAAFVLCGLWGTARAASHYPTDSLCYDCHAISRVKMVTGTHLIKKSQKTVDLGITSGSTPIRCLFCHEKNAVSVAGRTEMMGVWDHFNASSTSKHPADVQSQFTGNPSALDCLDCHTGLNGGVVSDGGGNATIHGVDAATQDVNLQQTLIGWIPAGYSVSQHTCQNGACHDADGGGVGDYNAPKLHATGDTTINDGAAPTSCTQCHGDHNSYQNTSLITLRTDGSTSNNTTDPLSTRVTPDLCGECHTQDDGGASSPFETKGHGAATSVSGGRAMNLTCTTCHEPTEPHSFSRSFGGTDPMRFKFAEGATVSSLTQKNSYSICRTCHAQFDGKLHGALDVGCLDCHEPHGTTVGSNDIMVRGAVPADYTRDTDGAVQPANQGVNDTLTYTVAGGQWWDGVAGDMCDNQDCHGGVQSGLNGTTAIHPLSSFMTSNQHSDGNKTVGTDCSACHKHLDSAGAWRAQDSCTTCHGQPPPPADSGYSTFNEARTPHLKHAGQGAGAYRIACTECHNQYPGQHQNGTYQSVVFDGTTNPTGAYNAGARTCATLYCHSNGTSTSATNATPVAWNDANWDTTNLACNACHGGIDLATRIATGSHAIHLARAGITCTSCHSATVGALGTDLTTDIADVSVHANRVKNVVPGGTFTVGGTVAFSFVQGADTCSNVSCHGGYANVNWGAATNCANCHGTFGLTANGVAMPAAVVTKHSGALANPDANLATTLYNSHQGTAVLGANGEGRCDWCHANTQPAYTAGMHLDGQIQINSSGTYQGASGFTGASAGCATACHSGNSPYQMGDSGNTLASIAGQGFSCGSCHTGGVTPASASAAHTAHGAGTAQLLDGGAACVACHGNNGGLGYHNATAGTHGSGDVTFATVTYSQAAVRGNLTGTCLTSACHNKNTGTLQSTAWNTTQLDCDDCHYYSATPTGAGNAANPAPLSTSHNDHFDNGKVCAQCHGPVPASGDTVHITVATTVTDKANAAPDEAAIAWNDALAVTDYTFDDAGNTCYSATNQGLGCHASGGDAGVADPSRPDWDTSFPSTNCTTYCHSNNTDANTNPVSGLHGVVPSITGQAHDETMPGGGCSACHNPPAATHQNGAFTGNGTVAGDRTNMGLGAFYTTSGVDNAGTCANTGVGCHGGAGTFRDDWAHEWNSTAGYYTTNTTACAGCHGDWANGWNAGTIHRTSVGTQSKHGTGTTWDCRDCHALEATTNNYTFAFGTTDWFPLNATSEHGNATIEVNNNGVAYAQATGLCGPCHTTSDNVHNFLDTSWPIAGIGGDAVTVSCGECHTGGVTPATASGAHTAHGAGTAQLVEGGAACVACHGNNGGPGFSSTLAGTHGTGTVTFATVTYSQAAVRGNLTGTCLTSACHNKNTGTLQSTAWNTTQLDCDDCHYYSATPTGAGNAANPAPLSTSHNDHFDNGKVCAQCHGPVPASGDTVHITVATTVTDKANAAPDEAAIAWNDALAVTDYTFDDAGNTCYSATNQGLGCHASGGDAGVADPSRPDWDTSFPSTNCTTYCHSNNTDANTNPVSGLHGVVPSITGQAHDETMPGGGCSACHNPPAATHQNGAFTGNGTVAGDRTNMGLGAFYTTSGVDNAGTCANTGVGCHGGAGTFRDDWAHEWNSTAGYYTTNTTACAGCHGDWANGWNAGTIHRTSVGTQSKHGTGTTWDCRDCHALEATTNNYTFAFGTTDWFPLNATSEHGNATIEVNNNGVAYAQATGLCGPCHTTSDNVHNFLDTSWPIAGIGGDAVTVSCGECHTGGVTPATASGAHTAHGAGTAQLVAGGAACVACHGNNGGNNYQNVLAGSHGTGTVTWTTNLTYSTAVRNDTTGTCSGNAGCHVSSGTNIQWGQTQVGTNDCRLCHQGTADVNSYAWEGTATGISKVSSTEYGAVGHGSANGNATGCMACHDITVPHDQTAGLTGTNPFRLVDQVAGGGLDFSCSFNNASCHPSGTATNEGALGLTYGAIQNHERANFASPQVNTWGFTPKCVDCHDPHGDGGNVKMMHNDLWDNGSGANWVPTDYATIGNPNVAFTVFTTGQSTAGTAYADTNSPWSSLCQECHETGDADMTSYKDGVRADIAPHPASPGDCSDCHKHEGAFQPSGCNGCHGFPPVRAAEVAQDPANYVAENYAGGGGAHAKHIAFLKDPARLGAATSSAQELCGPCHGDGAGIDASHNGSSQGSGAWALSTRLQVNVRSRAAGQDSWDGMGGGTDPVNATYGGAEVTATGAAVGANAAVNSANSRCVGVDCHGNPSASDTVEVLWWNVDVAANAPGTDNGTEESRTCEGCHDQTPAQVRVYNAAGTGLYTGDAPDAAVSYYGTLSGYARGGHGDPEIQNEDPAPGSNGRPDATGTTPLECTDCHDAAAAHFPEAAGDLHRLGGNTAIQTNTAGLCNDCHPSADYPDNHHPSYYGPTMSNPTAHDIIPVAGSEARTAISTNEAWVEVTTDHFEQAAYGFNAAVYGSGVDRFVNWWASSYGLGNQTPPKPVFYGEAQSAGSRGMLPLSQFVGNQSGTNQVMCVTCHNPHGTDLFTFDALDGSASPGGPNADIPDNNMLRLRDSDNTLCNACH